MERKKILTHLHPHRCTGAGCTRKPRIPIAEALWDVCPLGVVDGPVWAPVAALWQASHVSPLANWPHGYAAWMVRALISVHTEVHRSRPDDE